MALKKEERRLDSQNHSTPIGVINSSSTENADRATGFARDHATREGGARCHLSEHNQCDHGHEDRAERRRNEQTVTARAKNM